ncbi:wax ester/triacylglycerol synthase domain-containing protein [Saccharomonospora xinjiangensis]|uniref:wax ester/triacylglycerol synthase domain-containing protein n=2 Tax=Saccharomonospora xinjiangensis TaxID=75294 RepID=UPI00106FD415|nr:wax ester/triacylglycerol synthase domain-containing protein [Saccharomonospora xinjiangensis]QBQ60920.1 putative diacylglycerol O-acyltransferase tgs1 [Saccharomonospora xinjiangensis]
MRTSTAPRLLVVFVGTASPPLSAVHRSAQHAWPDADVVAEPVTAAPAGGAGTGRELGRLLDRVRPDAVLAVHPSVAAGLDWLRRRRGFGLPTATWDPSTGTAGLDAMIRLLAAAPARPAPRTLPASDALFAHVDSPAVPQHVGTVLVFEPGTVPTVEQAAAMLATVPGAFGRLAPARLTRPARWLPVEGRVAPDAVDTVTAVDLPSAVDSFFSDPLNAARSVGEARLVTGLADGRSALLVKLHHALGDGMTVLQALLSDTDDAASLSWASRPSLPMSWPGVPGLRAGPRPVLSGLGRLAVAGRAPKATTDGPVPDALRHHALGLLAGKAVRVAARDAGVGAAEYVLATFAQAWHDVTGTERGTFRLMVPWSVRGTDSLRMAGNHTGAVSVDLPVGPMDLTVRARRVAAALRSRTGTGVPEAANLVVQALGLLPPTLHRAAARLVYRGGWFNAVGTVMPGPRREVRWHGAVMSRAYPVLALAPETGLAWGALTWGPWITVCVTAHADAAPLADALTQRMQALVTGSTLRETS